MLAQGAQNSTTGQTVVTGVSGQSIKIKSLHAQVYSSASLFYLRSVADAETADNGTLIAQMGIAANTGIAWVAPAGEYLWELPAGESLATDASTANYTQFAITYELVPSSS